MPRCYSDEQLRRLRNKIPFRRLFVALRWPHKRRNQQLVFVCPSCSETQSAVNPRTNLARCFRCERNFNPIDFTMEVRECDFVAAVQFLESSLLPR